MLDAVKYGFSNVLNFEGRDARGTFWYYVLFLVLAQFLLTLVASVPMYMSIFTSAFNAAAEAQGSEEMVLDMAEEMVGYVRTITLVGYVAGTITALLMVASFVRRLHDAGYTGWIVVIPLLTQAFSMSYSYSFMERIEEVMMQTMTQSMVDPTGEQINPYAVQAEMGLLGLVGWIGYILIITFGVFRSQEGPNKYGEAPVSF